MPYARVLELEAAEAEVARLTLALAAIRFLDPSSQQGQLAAAATDQHKCVDFKKENDNG